MKVFINANTFGDQHPDVLAHYPDDAEISDKAHGEIAMLVHVPDNALIRLIDEDTKEYEKKFRLRQDWRELAGKKPYSKDQKIGALFELISYLLKYGTDRASWPAKERNRLAELEKKFM